MNHHNSLLAALMLLVCNLASAANLVVQVNDKTGVALENVVIYAESAGLELKPKSPHLVEIAQIKRQFVPLVTVVQTGSEISFPNFDSIRHHVYSFSTAKKLDLPLYFGRPAVPQVFDKAGTVVLGCNIHDRMIAYVQVVNTPYFGKSDAAGKVRLEGLPAGKYQLNAWYYGLPVNQQVISQSVTVADGELSVVFKVNASKSDPNAVGDR